MQIKICGITNLEDALLCASYGVNALGFIFYNKSPRYIIPSEVKNIINQLPVFVNKVGVFVNHKKDEIDDILKEVNLDYLQFHGEESNSFINQFHTKRLIKSFRIKDDYNYDILNTYTNCTFLLDTFNTESYGGTGTSFNWNSIPFNILRTSILAGGINLDNIDLLNKEYKPAAIDICSGLELNPGIKDHNKIKSFFSYFNNIRNIKC